MLADPDLLALWDRCQGRPPAVRALELLAAAEPAADPAALPAGRREQALLRLHARHFGGRLDAVATCPACTERLDVAVDAADLLAAAGTAGDGELVVRHGGYEVRFRVPTAGDLAALPRDGGELLGRCVVAATRSVEGAAVGADELPVAVRAAVEEAMEAADPGAELTLALTCPACGHGWTEPLDPVAFVWTAVDARARRVAGDVHALAAAYGWSEAEILSLSPARRRLYLEVVRE